MMSAFINKQMKSRLLSAANAEILRVNCHNFTFKLFAKKGKHVRGNSLLTGGMDLQAQLNESVDLAGLISEILTHFLR
jgi:hypothetical protein